MPPRPVVKTHLAYTAKTFVLWDAPGGGPNASFRTVRHRRLERPVCHDRHGPGSDPAGRLHQSGVQQSDGAAYHSHLDHLRPGAVPGSVTASSLRVFGKQTGRKTGAIVFTNSDKTVTITPTEPFAAGELVLVNLANTILAADSSPFREAGYSFQFFVQTQPAARCFDAIQTQSNKTGRPDAHLRRAAADLNDDGYIDLTTVNEVSADCASS